MSFMGPKLYNLLSLQIKEITNPKNYYFAVKTWLQEKYTEINDKLYQLLQNRIEQGPLNYIHNCRIRIYLKITIINLTITFITTLTLKSINKIEINIP